MKKEPYDSFNAAKSDYLSVVMEIANSLETKDDYTKKHCERVTEYSLAIAKQMNLYDKELEDLEFAGLLHDIGKVVIPDSIINKSDKLTEEEYQIIKKHPEIGYDIVKDVDFLSASSEILLQHHERVDGKGYPYGLSGNKINRLARILAVADAYDAMTSERPYRRNAFTKEQAIVEFDKNRNTQFDSEVVDVFISVLSK
jgi:putative nucleotidyltransferase with HDIG domain